MNLFSFFTRPATAQVHTDTERAPWHRSRDNWSSVQPVDYYAPEPVTDVYAEILEMLITLPFAKQRRLATLMRHGYRIGMVPA